MKTNFIPLIFLLFIIISSCKKEDKLLEENEYLIFGHFYGLCLGEECIETFKLTESMLYEDLNDEYFGEGPFNFIPLNDNKFNLVADLPSYLPQNLVALPDSTFGCPDCVDQGGLFIQYAHDGLVQEWRIDQISPLFLEDFVDKVNEKITLINQ